MEQVLGKFKSMSSEKDLENTRVRGRLSLIELRRVREESCDLIEHNEMERKRGTSDV